ncbi:MAG: glycosyltransferase family 9 protein [Candidatus Omnitrophica bacterium]|nr:glycosyltransferase family 9 protein [Candidatus Omnitrophota bacterium]MCM8770313.1 glycosyltransferase family 9 protein [Candidatus Omnitrophota bacterium]
MKNILVVRNDRFGEFILNIPAIRALKNSFSSARLNLIVSPQVKPLAQKLEFVDNVIEWDNKRNHRFFEKVNFIKFLKKQKFDLAVMLNPSKEFNIFTYLAGIPIRVGYDRKWSFLLTHKLKDLKYLGKKHEVEYNLDLVSLIGISTNDKSILINIDKQDEIFVDNLFKKYNISESNNLVVLHPWTSDSVKQWPLENFKVLAKRLIEELFLKVIVIGGEEERGKSGVFTSDISDIINLTGELTLLQAAALLKKSRLLISNDSGPIHLAASVNTGVIAIFRSDLPEKSARRWGPWGEGHIIIEKADLSDISVDEVFNTVRNCLRYESAIY